MKMGYMIAGITPEVIIILTVSDIFDVGWAEIIRKIDEILQEPSYAALNLSVKLGNWRWVAPTSIAPGQFQQKVPIGSSIGPNSGSGTLVLQVKTTSSVGAVEILWLTNYNCHPNGRAD